MVASGWLIVDGRTKPRSPELVEGPVLSLSKEKRLIAFRVFSSLFTFALPCGYTAAVC